MSGLLNLLDLFLNLEKKKNLLSNFVHFLWEFLALLSASLLTEVVVSCYKLLTNCLQVLDWNSCGFHRILPGFPADFQRIYKSCGFPLYDKADTPQICNIVTCTYVCMILRSVRLWLFFSFGFDKKTMFSTRAKKVIPQKASQNSPNLRSDPHQTLFYYYLLVQLVFKPVFRVL